MKTFTAKLRNIEQVKFPIVKAAFKGKDGNVYIGAMMVDTGSVHCILNKSVLPLIDESCVIEGKTMNIHSIQGKCVKCQGISFNFKMGNGEFADTYYVNETIDFNAMFDGALIGIIGHEFLRKNKLVLDYNKEELRHSDGKLAEEVNDYEFFFPMEFGLKKYNLPIVGIASGEKEYILVADSGANSTIMTKHVVEDAGICKEILSNEGDVTCFSNETMNTDFCHVTLSLVSVGGTTKEPKLFVGEDIVQTISDYEYLMDGLKDPEGNDVPPICGLLSSVFMHRNKWVLDFGVGLMYKAAA